MVRKLGDALQNPLALWLALELRRSRAAFHKIRKAHDAEFIGKGMPKCGPRVTLALNSAAEICVALADATIAKAGDFVSTPEQLAEAEKAVLAFTRDITNSIIPLAYFVSGESGLGGSAVKATNDRGTQLYRDIQGAFVLAKAPPNRQNASAFDRLFAILQSEGFHIWQTERDRINSEFAPVNRLQSGYHIKTLTEAAEQITTSLLDRAFPLSSPSTDRKAIQDFASSVFETLASEISEIAVSKTGRTPQPDNIVLAREFADDAKGRIEAKIDYWLVSTELTASTRSQSLAEATKLARAPAVKKGRPPSDELVLAKADDMKARGYTGYDIAAKMRLEPGFENVATTAVRQLIKGRWKGGRRSTKAAH